MKANLFTLILYLQSYHSYAYLTANDPIILKLQRLEIEKKNRTEFNANSSISFPKLIPINLLPRSKAALFSKALQLKPNTPFTIDLYNLQELQSSKLFTNLTIRPLINGNRVMLEVLGSERPSIHISPEVTVSASLDRPEVSGGIIYEDHNFRGLGEKFEFYVGKREGKEDGTFDLPLLVRAQWSECRLGSMCSISTGLEQDGTREDATDIVPIFHQPSFSPAADDARPTNSAKQSLVDQLDDKSCVLSEDTGGASTASLVNLFSSRLPVRAEVLTRRLWMRISGSVPFGFSNQDRKNSRQRSAIGLTVEPYVHQMMAMLPMQLSRSMPRSSYDSTAYGVKSTMQYVSKGGYSSKVWSDDGITSNSGAHAPFRVLGARVSLPALRRELNVQLPSWFPLNKRQLRIPTVWMSSISATRVVGNGAMPILHLVKAGASRILRGHSDRSKTNTLGGNVENGIDERLNGYIALHGDVYVGDKLGAFIDTGFYSGALSQEMGISTSLGVSVRSQGLRCDVAWAMGGDPLRPRIHLSADAQI